MDGVGWELFGRGLSSRALEPGCLQWVSPVPLLTCVTAGTGPHFSEPQVPHPLHGDGDPDLEGCSEDQVRELAWSLNSMRAFYLLAL